MKEFPIYHTFFAQSSLRDLFLKGELIDQWGELYPFLFDQKDIDTAMNQKDTHKTHFYEWFTAIQLFHQSGFYSLVERYEFNNHNEKHQRLEEVASKAVIKVIRNHKDYPSQCPDLLVYKRDYLDWFFIEVKGPNDSLKRNQKEFFTVLNDVSEKEISIVNIELI